MVLHVTYVANIYGYPFVVNIPAQSGIYIYIYLVPSLLYTINSTRGHVQSAPEYRSCYVSTSMDRYGSAYP